MASPSTQEHRDAAQALPAVRIAVLTVSDTRTEETDKSGALMRELALAEGHAIARYAILKDEPDEIRTKVVEWCDCGEVDAVLTNGGTGIAPRDGTFEAISSLLERTLPGFGEIFRMLSWHEVGAAAMLSRATAGLRGGTVVFSTPGSTNAVRLAMTKLILPEIRHLVYEMRGKRG